MMKFSTRKLITHHLTRNWHPILMGIKWVYRLKAAPELRLHRLTVSCSLSLFSYLSFFIFIYGVFFVFSALMQNHKVWLPSQLRWIVQTTRPNTIYVFSTIDRGLSMGWSGLGLYLTRNRPAKIRWQSIEPAANCQSNQIRWIKPSTDSRWVGRSHISEKTARKLWEKLRSNENLIEFYEIFPNLAKISPDLS